MNDKSRIVLKGINTENDSRDVVMGDVMEVRRFIYGASDLTKMLL